jgi:hypothetical protein
VGYHDIPQTALSFVEFKCGLVRHALLLFGQILAPMSVEEHRSRRALLASRPTVIVEENEREREREREKERERKREKE